MALSLPLSSLGAGLRFGIVTFAALAVPTVLLLGCGGKVGGDPGEDTGADTGIVDTGDEPDTDLPDTIGGPDGGPIGCGFGPCSPGIGCSDGCNSCECVAENTWECTDRYCPDAEPPPPPPPCPYPRPADRTYCATEGQVCEYKNSCGTLDYSICSLGPSGRVWMTKTDCTSPTPCPTYLPPKGASCTGYNKCGFKNSCGGVDTAVCNGSYWETYIGPCTTPTCPTYLPPAGAMCSGSLKCSYPNGCGGYHTAYCEGSASSWRILYGDCPPPPPPPICPTSTPSDGSPCASGLSCSWNNGCGGINYGYCGSGGWAIKRDGCSSSCPGVKPPSGASCSTPGTSSCRYVVSPGSSCTTQCFCADDYRWACVTPPCAEPTPFPGSDAGFP